MTKDTEKAAEPLNVVKDKYGCSPVVVVAGAMSDMPECVVVPSDVGVDVSATDMVYGYLVGAPCKTKETREYPLDVIPTVGNAVMVEVICVPHEVGADAAKAGTGFGLTRMICTTVGAGAL